MLTICPKLTSHMANSKTLIILVSIFIVIVTVLIFINRFFSCVHSKKMRMFYNVLKLKLLMRKWSRCIFNRYENFINSSFLLVI